MIHLLPLVGATRPDALTFVWSSVIIIFGALGVVIARNPVHSALMLVMTLFGVAIIFIELQANFLAAVQVIVYAGAIVVLFLFVIMLLGVDKKENLEKEPLRGQRPIAVALVALALGGVLGLGFETHWSVGAHSVAGPRNQTGGDVAALGRSVFTTYLFPFEVTAALLVIAVVGAVVLSRQSGPLDSTSTSSAASPETEDSDGDGGPSGGTAGQGTDTAKDLISPEDEAQDIAIEAESIRELTAPDETKDEEVKA
ncbi:MAG: NADH-quinone oxidoreductase subunit J [Acidimicrobiales bacterium]